MWIAKKPDSVAARQRQKDGSAGGPGGCFCRVVVFVWPPVVSYHSYKFWQAGTALSRVWPRFES